MDFKKQMADQIIVLASKLDRKQIRNAVEELKISEPTLIKYLAGQGVKLDMYEKIFNHFKQNND